MSFEKFTPAFQFAEGPFLIGSAQFRLYRKSFAVLLNCMPSNLYNSDACTPEHVMHPSNLQLQKQIYKDLFKCMGTFVNLDRGSLIGNMQS